MRGTLKRLVTTALAVGVVYVTAALGEGGAVVIRPSDLVRVDAKGAVVEVVVAEAKAREISKKPKRIPIELSIPNSAAAGVFTCETRYGRNSATISFKFADRISAADFADELKAAKAKSQCDCRD